MVMPWNCHGERMLRTFHGMGPFTPRLGDVHGNDFNGLGDVILLRCLGQKGNLGVQHERENP